MGGAGGAEVPFMDTCCSEINVRVLTQYPLAAPHLQDYHLRVLCVGQWEKRCAAARIWVGRDVDAVDYPAMVVGEAARL